MKKVVIGMSSGVDSSVSAYLLKEQGYKVIGVTLNQHLEETSKDVEDAKRVCEKLGIIHIVINIRKDFDEECQNYENEINYYDFNEELLQYRPIEMNQLMNLLYHLFFVIINKRPPFYHIFFLLTFIIRTISQ